MTPKRKPCGGCGKRKASTGESRPTRVSCLECVEKHIGAAMILAGEERDGYSHRLRIIGHLHEAADESQEWPELSSAARHARKEYQHGRSVDWQALERLCLRVAGGSASLRSAHRLPYNEWKQQQKENHNGH